MLLQLLFRMGDQPDDLFIIHSGTILCRMHPVHPSSAMAMPPLPAGISHHPSGVTSSEVDAEESRSDADGSTHHSLFQYGPGAIIGELDFFLSRPRSFIAHADGAVQLLVLPRTQFEHMAREAPALTTLLQAAMLRCTCLSAAHALEALETSSTV